MLLLKINTAGNWLRGGGDVTAPLVDRSCASAAGAEWRLAECLVDGRLWRLFETSEVSSAPKGTWRRRETFKKRRQTEQTGLRNKVATRAPLTFYAMGWCRGCKREGRGCGGGGLEKGGGWGLVGGAATSYGHLQPLPHPFQKCTHFSRELAPRGEPPSSVVVAHSKERHCGYGV